MNPPLRLRWEAAAEDRTQTLSAKKSFVLKILRTRVRGFVQPGNADNLKRSGTRRPNRFTSSAVSLQVIYIPFLVRPLHISYDHAHG